MNFLLFRIFEQFALALKNFTVLKYVYHSGFLGNLRLPWKFSRPEGGGRSPAYGPDIRTV